MARTIVRTSPKIKTIYLTEHCSTDEILYKMYQAQRCVFVVPRGASLMMVCSQSTIGRIRGIPDATFTMHSTNANIVYLQKKLLCAYSFSIIETKLLRHLEKAGKMNFIAIYITSRSKYSKNVPLFYSNTNPIITTIYLTQHCSTQWKQSTWCDTGLLEKKERTKTLKNVGKTQQTQQGEFIGAGTNIPP